MMLPLQLDLLTPPGTRWLMEWMHDGIWLPEVVRDTINQAIQEGRQRMRDISWVTWRVRPYIEKAAEDDETYYDFPNAGGEA